MSIELFDTAARKVVPFTPEKVVRMYICGITPYDSTHLGHGATYLIYDLLIRRLEYLGHEVRMVRNITDVDDSILPKARELGIPYLELAASEISRFQSDMDALDIRPPFAEPRATESIDAIIEMINKLLISEHAYLTHGTVYFDVSTFSRFGELSHYSVEHMIKLARARGGIFYAWRGGLWLGAVRVGNGVAGCVDAATRRTDVEIFWRREHHPGNGYDRDHGHCRGSGRCSSSHPRARHPDD